MGTRRGPANQQHDWDSQLDENGRAYVPLFPDAAEVTAVVIGHPVVCDHPELTVQVTLRDSDRERDSWHVSVNNTGDTAIATRCESAMELPGFRLEERAVTVAAGGHVVLN